MVIFEYCSEDDLAAFGDSHPALEYLMKGVGFDWPTTDVVVSSNRLAVDFADGEWPETGVLKHMGYTVGQQGLSAAARHQILDRVMVVELVPGSAGASSYIQQWGQPMTAGRLHKIANCLAAFAVSMKRVKARDYREAIADWESDLKYLQETYYRPNLGFHWPNAVVPPN